MVSLGGERRSAQINGGVKNEKNREDNSSNLDCELVNDLYIYCPN